MSGPGTTLDPVYARAIEAVNTGSITWGALAKVLSRSQAEPEPEPVPKLALPRSITPPQQVALEKLAEVFCSVVPTERRALEPKELVSLAEERRVLDTIAKMVETRKADLRTTLLHHFDTEAEADGRVSSSTLRDKDGHYLIRGDTPIPDSDDKFTFEVTEAEPVISEGALEAIAADSTRPELGPEDWEACTRMVRVFDPHQAILHLRERPDLLPVIAEATTPGKARGAFWIRKR